MLKNGPYLFQSELYVKFLGIGLKKYRKVILFYEEHEIQIMALHFDEYFELFISYINALFEVGEHQKFLLNVDEGIELSIARPVHLYRGEDLYHKLLFRKAACLYHQMRYAEARYILEELIKIQPWNDHTIMFLKKCNRAKKPRYVMDCIAAGVFIFIITAIIIAIEVFFIRQYFDEHTSMISAARNAMFLLGVVVLASGQSIHFWKTHKVVENFVAKQRKRKRQLKREKVKQWQ